MNSEKSFLSLFASVKPVIGMIHVEALPGTPKNQLHPQEIIAKAVNEAKVYFNAGIDSIMIENMHDIPYLNRNVGPEISTLMSIVAYEIKREINIPLGMQILAGANKQALAAAYSAGIDFIRCEGFVFAHVADEGIISSDAGELLRYRKQIDAENVFILTDIKKKHSSHTITNDVSLKETAHAAEFFNSDGLIITGSATGDEPKISDLDEVKGNCNLPIIIGSGITEQNFGKYKDKADAFIIGSYFKKEGIWVNEVESVRVESFIKMKNR